MKFVADVEFSLTQEELENFSKLSQELNLEFADTVRKCMTEKCEEYLQTFTTNVPTEDETK